MTEHIRIYREEPDDCRRCYGLHRLYWCHQCGAWLCERCWRVHSHEAFSDMLRRLRTP